MKLSHLLLYWQGRLLPNLGELSVKNFILFISILMAAGDCAVHAQGANTFAVKEIASGVFVAEGQVALAGPDNAGAIANRIFIIGEKAVAVIDTGGSFAAGAALKSAIQAQTNVPIRYVVNTHMHPDHVLGNAAFAGEGVVFAGHAKLARALAARAGQYLPANRLLIGDAAFAGTQIVAPTLMVEHETRIDLGNRVLRLTAYPTAHTDNDLTVFDASTGTLILGDLLFQDHLPVIDGSLNGWLAVLDGLVKQPAARAVPGHGSASVPWPQAAAGERGYLSALRDDLRVAIRAGWPLARALGDIKPQGVEHWRLVDDYHKRNISAGFAELEWE
jgi:quinoprotein relay system zinc metallohydrolase 2